MKVLLAAISIAILGCSSAQLGTSRIDPVLAALVPADTILLAGIRMNEVRTTALYTQMMSQERLIELDDFAKKTNFDPRKDVNDMLLASNGVDNVVLARGNFKVQAPKGATKSAYKGATIYGNAEGAYAILNATTAVAGVEAAVRRAIDQKQSGRPGPAALLDRARSLTGTGQVWFVSTGWGRLPDRLGAQGGNLSNMSRLFRTVESATGTADLRSGLAADVNGQCKSEQDAKTLGDAARGLVGLGRLSVPENQPEMLRLFDGIKVEQKEKSVQVAIRIPPDLLDKALKK